MAGLTNVLWAPMAGPTFYCGRQMAGPTEVSPSLWAPNGWPHILLWAPMAAPTEVSPPPSIYRPVCGRQMAGPTFSCGRRWLAPRRFPHPHHSIVPYMPTYLLRVRSVHRPEFSVRLGGGGWCLNYCPLDHLRLCRYLRLCLRHVRHQIFRRSDSLSYDNRPCPSVPLGTPVIQHHPIFACACSWTLWILCDEHPDRKFIAYIGMR